MIENFLIQSQIVNPKSQITLFGFFYFDDLTPFVCSGFGIDTVRFFRLAGFFVDVVLRQFQRVVRTALACA